MLRDYQKAAIQAMIDAVPPTVSIAAPSRHGQGGGGIVTYDKSHAGSMVNLRYSYDPAAYAPKERSTRKTKNRATLRKIKKLSQKRNRK